MKTIIIGISDGPVVHFNSAKELKQHADAMKAEARSADRNADWSSVTSRAIMDKIVRKKKGRK